MARVLVIGAGALGGLLGALLAEARHTTLLLGRDEQVRAITLAGLALKGGAYGTPRNVPLVCSPRAPDAYEPDLVVLAVKTQDVERALKDHSESIGRAPIVAIQNGLAQDEMVAAAVGKARAVSAIAALDAQHVQPGVIECARRGSLVIGARWSEGEAAAERARGILGEAVKVVRTRNALGARWSKLLVNLGNVVPALTDLTFQEAASHPRLALAHVAMIREGVRVAEAEGAKLARLPWTSPALLRAVGKLPDAVARRAYTARVKLVLGRAPARGSTWQSLQRGRSVETEWLNGEVSRRGRARGVATPANDAAVRLALEGRKMSADGCADALLGARVLRPT